jgi:hypothetical protein
MDPVADTQNEDSTCRLAEVTATWESSPLTEPELASDRRAKSPADHGRTNAPATDLEREEQRIRRTDH